MKIVLTLLLLLIITGCEDTPDRFDLNVRKYNCQRDQLIVVGRGSFAPTEDRWLYRCNGALYTDREIRSWK